MGLSSVDPRVFGMRPEELKEWMAGVSEHAVLVQVRRWTANVRAIFFPVPASRRRPGNFICDRHWKQVEATFDTDDPIDPLSVTVGLVTALHLSGQYTEPKAVPHACCTLNDYGWKGILKRSRPSFFKEASPDGRRRRESRAADR